MDNVNCYTKVTYGVSVLDQVDRAISYYQKDLSSEDRHALLGEEEFRYMSEIARPSEPQENR
ncbi:hypothetical protein VTJ49DRAFT_6244 [Mycothermus thermophilus]|uniref:Uncharacterized protein n=1 Tax=Humicola insolens TaxID=85995 RepID=A0ABR3V2Q2_HUMIN